MRDPIKIILGESEMAAVIDVFRVFEVGFRSGLLKAEVIGAGADKVWCPGNLPSKKHKYESKSKYEWPKEMLESIRKSELNRP